ncbi:protein DEHYDRATION-INDUCED 19 homolog 3-like isoform X2 [Durio zibethinus]|uniref:Protein DEHYDRATION-INDUCED 19 homolog 3-like isoform X2 n=1 Tax=Durio zibethinus TaxID=66656 RepID=A0A6P6B168_DURZI|nr:protein DEHYDRATION-INDUCED 19 homolog 3-like isoform X2 [Durio zibethinus]
MEDDTWSFAFSASSRSYQSTLKSQNLCIDFEEIEEDDELKTEYPCPYCSEDFDLLGLCCHIDEEHHLEAGYGVCPVCSLRVGMNMVDHITTQHGNIYKSNRKLKFCKGNSYSTLSSLRKDLDDAHYQSLLARSWSSLSSSNTAPDPLLSFLSYAPPADSSEGVQSASSTEVSLEVKGSDENMLEKDVHSSPLSDKENLEKAKMCEFVQGLLLSTIFD